MKTRQSRSREAAIESVLRTHGPMTPQQICDCLNTVLDLQLNYTTVYMILINHRNNFQRHPCDDSRWQPIPRRGAAEPHATRVA